MKPRRAPLLILLPCAIAAGVLPPWPALAKAPFKGPVTARVISVRDGDTFLADAEIWPGQYLRVNIRIRGIDAPEMKARCATERRAALRARDLLADLVAQSTVSISNIGGAKYYGRVLADVDMQDGRAVAALLLESDVVRPYGGGRRLAWCPAAGVPDP